MWRRLSLILALTLSLVAVARKNYVQLPAQYAGSMMPYDFNKVNYKPVWPDSLKPVYLARVSRHGARYISSANKLDKLREAISKASAKGSLTKEGLKFSQLVKRVEDVSEDKWGLLSDVGVEEEQRLADSLYALLPELLKTARVNAMSTYVPRVVKTMYEFNHQLAVKSSDISITASEGRVYSPLLRCFTADTAYAAYRDNGNWKEISKRLMDSIVSPEPARRLLGASYGVSDNELRKLTLEMYDVLQSLTAFGMEAPTDEFMSAEDYRACWEVDNLEHYLRNSITAVSKLAGKATAPLLARIISDADNALGNRLVADAMHNADMAATDAPLYFGANFYFGHAETLMPLLSLMRVDGCYDDSSEFSTLSQRWKDYEIVPLAANIDIILLESPSGVIYAALSHNGRFVAPIAGNRSVWVPWAEYKAYLSRQILSI